VSHPKRLSSLPAPLRSSTAKKNTLANYYSGRQ
jgi:hypothetical protein